MTSDDYELHDAIGLAAQVESGEVSPSELLDAALARTADRNPSLNAIVIDMEKQARSAIEAGLPEGPLRGVPFLLKDLHLLYEGERSTNGSMLFRDNRADHDSELVKRYKQAGLVIFGKSASPEFGVTATTESTLYGDTRNPWNLEHSAGGSSGGASSAISGGILPAANASDGGGSIRIPASCCGLFGLKPTRGRTPFGPDAGEGWSGMSCMHAITRSVRDSAALLDATQGPDIGAPYIAPPPERPYLEEVGANPGRLRISLQKQPWNAAETHPDCIAGVEDAARLLADLGHDVKDAPFEVDFSVLGPATSVIMSANLRAMVDERLQKLGRELQDDDLEPITRSIYDGAGKRSAVDYARAVRSVHAVGRVVAGHLQDYDLILSPTMAAPPLPLGAISLSNADRASYGRDILSTVGFTQLFNASGNPAASIPLCWNEQGLPIGIQLAARFGDEATLFRVSAQLEEARPWFARRPPMLQSGAA
ncbi:MAG: amidase [Myxococcota bacterium]|nr:amidase [Myxococcota bacterium]